MWHRHGGEAAHPLGHPAGQDPPDHRTPVVTDHVRRRPAQGVEEPLRVGDETVDRVRGHVDRPDPAGVAALVGGDGVDTGEGEQWTDAVPAARPFREAVQQQDRDAVGRPPLEGVELSPPPRSAA